jgi:hypothetical protein
MLAMPLQVGRMGTMISLKKYFNRSLNLRRSTFLLGMGVAGT